MVSLGRARTARRNDVSMRMLAGSAAAGLLLAFCGVLGGLGAAPAAADPVPVCPTQDEMPLLGTVPIFTDNNLSTFVGGDFTVSPAAAESEGVLVVLGSATIDKRPAGGSYNVGSVGVGSGIVPAPGSTMFAVGGSLTVQPNTNLILGAGLSLGGSLSVGGAFALNGTLQTNGGSAGSQLGTPAVAQWAGFPAQLAAASAQLAGLPPLTTTVSPAPLPGGSTVTFTGDGTDALQVFTVDASQLTDLRTVRFDDILPNAPVVVNVTGGPVTLAPTAFLYNGVLASSTTSPDFPTLASTTLWNFADAQALTITGVSHFVGSIIAPEAATTTVTQSTNGRLYVGGNLAVSGQGTEQHSYPWNGPVTPTFDCVNGTPVLASMTIEKVLTPGSFLDDAPPQFGGEVRCEPVGGGEWAKAWTITPPGTATLNDLPIGADCAVTEALPSLPDALSWAPPEFTLNGQPFDGTFVAPDPSGADDVAVTVTNLVLGTFEVEKLLDDPDEAYIGDREFPVEWECSEDGYVDGVEQPGLHEGTLELIPNDPPVSPVVGSEPVEFPAGTECSVAEPTILALPGDFVSSIFSWGDPIVSSPVTIGAEPATAGLVTVVVDIVANGSPPGPGPTPGPAPGDDPGTSPAGRPPLPATGFPGATLAGAGGILIVVGALALLARRKPRTR